MGNILNSYSYKLLYNGITKFTWRRKGLIDFAVVGSIPTHRLLMSQYQKQQK